MTQHAVMGPEIHIDRAQGAYLYSGDREILDGIASWWVITHGHCHPKIVEAVQQQAPKLEQVIFAGFTHEPAEALAEHLLKFTAAHLGPGLDYIFYSDSGSTAIEVALKMAIGFHQHSGRARNKVLALEGGYHGDTFGAMSTGARGVFNKVYENFLFEVSHIQPDLQQLEDYLRAHGSETAAFVLEPLVQGANAFAMYEPEILAAMAAMCREYGVLLIADEVMTGFGRTGTPFACQKAGFAPDLLCLSKGLTGGFLPMGATLCSAEIYNAFYQKDRAKTFFHSTSFSGNALACAAAKASLEIWEAEPVQKRIESISSQQAKAAEQFKSHADIVDVRHMGTLLAIDVKTDSGGYLSNLGPFLYDSSLSQDVLLRPIGNTIYVLPPYCVTKEDLEKIYGCINITLDRLRDERKQQAA